MSTPVAGSVVSTPASILGLNQQLLSEEQALDSALPPPEIFDLLPALHELLSRLLSETNDPSRQPTYQDQKQLSIAELAAESSVLKSKIRKAREAVDDLPGIEMSLEHQQREFKLLEARVEQQTRVLKGLAEV